MEKNLSALALGCKQRANSCDVHCILFREHHSRVFSRVKTLPVSEVQRLAMFSAAASDEETCGNTHPSQCLSYEKRQHGVLFFKLKNQTTEALPEILLAVVSYSQVFCLCIFFSPKPPHPSDKAWHSEPRRLTSVHTVVAAVGKFNHLCLPACTSFISAWHRLATTAAVFLHDPRVVTLVLADSAGDKWKHGTNQFSSKWRLSPLNIGWIKRIKNQSRLGEPDFLWSWFSPNFFFFFADTEKSPKNRLHQAAQFKFKFLNRFTQRTQTVTSGFMLYSITEILLLLQWLTPDK